jgi:hypothetical protein
MDEHVKVAPKKRRPDWLLLIMAAVTFAGDGVYDVVLPHTWGNGFNDGTLNAFGVFLAVFAVRSWWALR